MDQKWAKGWHKSYHEMFRVSQLRCVLNGHVSIIMEMLKTTSGFFEWGKLHYFAGYPTSLVGYALVLSIYVR